MLGLEKNRGNSPHTKKPGVELRLSEARGLATVHVCCSHNAEEKEVYSVFQVVEVGEIDQIPRYILEGTPVVGVARNEELYSATTSSPHAIIPCVHSEA